MSNELYFVPKIAAGLQQSDAFAGVTKAIGEITRLGGITAYAEGWTQFKLFMVTVAEGTFLDRLDALETVMGRELMLKLATGTLPEDPEDREAALALLRSRPKWHEDFERLSRTWDEAPCDRMFPSLLLSREGRQIATFTFDGDSCTHSVADLLPGHFSLFLDTGRLLWEGNLTSQHLLWTKAFPDLPIALAADTDGTVAQPAAEIVLLGGELVLRVCPGIEAGRLDIELRAEEGGNHAR